MPTTDDVIRELAQLPGAGGRNLVDTDVIRALSVTPDAVSFVLEAPDATFARALEPVRAEAERRLRALGFARVSIVTTAPAGKGPSVAAQSGSAGGAGGAPPSLKIGGHPKPQAGPQAIPGVDRIVAIGSGKGAAAGRSTPTSLTMTPSGSRSRKTGSPNSRLGPSTGTRAVIARVSQSPMLDCGTAKAISPTWPWPVRPGAPSSQTRKVTIEPGLPSWSP